MNAKSSAIHIAAKVVYPCAAIVSPCRKIAHGYICQVRLLQPDFFDGITELVSDTSVDIHVDYDITDDERSEWLVPIIAAAQSWYTKYAPKYSMMIDKTLGYSEVVKLSSSTGKGSNIVLAFTPIHVFVNPIDRHYIVQFVLRNSTLLSEFKRFAAFVTLRYCNSYVSKCLCDVSIWTGTQKQCFSTLSFSARGYREQKDKFGISLSVLENNITHAAIVRGLLYSAIQCGMLQPHDLYPGTVCYFTRVNRNIAAVTVELLSNKEDE